MFLKQSTAAVISFGPFVDKGDGVTLETGLVSALDHASTGILLSKNGGALTIRHATVTATTYDAYGCYRVTLDTTDTNTLGRLRMAFSEAATCLPVWQDFLVLPANVFDSLLSTDKLQVHVDEMTAGIITAAVLASDAITAAKVAADVSAEIADQVWDEALSTHSTAGSTGDALNDAASIPPTTAAIADAVWDEALAGHTTAGSAGKKLSDDPTAAAIADQVWDEAIAGHATAGSTGATLSTAASGSASAADIADAVWDEALSGHLTAGSTGDALNDAGGAASDPWDTALPGSYTSGKAGWILGNRLDAKVSSFSGNSPGTGATEFTYTLTEVGSGDPIADADVWVATDSGGTNVVASGRTDQDGEITFYLDPGTVYVFRQKSGWNFTNPDVEVIP